jgi:NIPSNAP
MIYEQRMYQAMPGRLPDLLKRFDQVTVPIWHRLGIRPFGFWTFEVGRSNQDLIYLLAWESMAERELKWPVFLADAEWHAKKTESERNGELVQSIQNAFLRPTAFSAVK